MGDHQQPPEAEFILRYLEAAVPGSPGEGQGAPRGLQGSPGWEPRSIPLPLTPQNPSKTSQKLPETSQGVPRAARNSRGLQGAPRGGPGNYKEPFKSIFKGLLKTFGARRKARRKARRTRGLGGAWPFFWLFSGRSHVLVGEPAFFARGVDAGFLGWLSPRKGW